MKKKIIITLAILIFVLISWKIYNEFFINKESQTKYYGNIDKRTVKLGFRFTGKIEDIKKDEGQNVSKDEILVTLENQNLKEQLKELEAKLESSNFELQKLKTGFRKEEISQAKANFEEAKMSLAKTTDTYTRQKELYKTKSVSEQSFILSELSYKQSFATLEKAKANYELLKNGYRIEDVQIQESNIKVLEAQIEKLKVDLKDTIITSPVNGTILSRYKEIGSITNPSETVLEIAKSDELWVRAYIDEKRLGDIKTGLEILVFSDSRKEPYNGYISFISPIAEFTPKNIETQELRADLVYSFRVIIKNFDDKLKQGMPVTLEVAK
ncbi:multidrug resistance ABC transporter, membrane fusion protein [Aliarcobacter faecis]|uniref:efflux RND transporter periplasmic adaptor subunit n=1 Tax=Aliarcobacter faecis TaxID=1564138 RepID=UPI00047CBF66|nr:efflux RND transporter periplasmic adaptor subunit [Aliarcobacter faecis]QKF74038.1 multidrug resistance ABC transporter, membrane fusion protein [Aliarcobacter faecis]